MNLIKNPRPGLSASRFPAERTPSGGEIFIDRGDRRRRRDG